MKFAKPNFSFRTTAAANSELRDVVIHIEPRIGEAPPSVMQVWVANFVGDFLISCPHIDDIAVEENVFWPAGDFFPVDTRIAALDARCSTESRGRKVRIRVGSVHYDIE